jgi:hypothetical protein
MPMKTLSLDQFIFVAVEGGPETLPAWDLFKQQLGLPAGAGGPLHSSHQQSKNRYGTVRRRTL